MNIGSDFIILQYPTRTPAFASQVRRPMTALATRLTDLLSELRRARAHVAALESDEMRLIVLGTADADARREAREIRREILMGREAIAEIKARIAAKTLFTSRIRWDTPSRPSRQMFTATC